MKKIVLSSEEIKKIEDETEKKYGIIKLILMENAGRCVSEETKKFIKNKKRKIEIFCGKGNNGGDGFVAARYLFNGGFDVDVFYIPEENKFSEITKRNFEILKNLGVKIFSVENKFKSVLKYKKCDLIIDAILGTGISGVVNDQVREMVEYINEKDAYKICVDVPSGLNADTGYVCGVAVKSNLTVSFGFGKKGFYMNEGPAYCGKIKIVDIGFPKFYYENK